MIKIEITIPLYYNDKKPIELEKLEIVKHKILKRFNGLTINHYNTGYWIDKNIEYKDKNDIYTIITDITYESDYWYKFKQELKALLQQNDIFIVISKVNII